MGFSAEVADFLAGFKAGSSIGGDIQDRKMQREKWEFDKAFKESAAARADRALDLRAKGMDARAADKAAKKAEADAAKAEKKRIDDANRLLGEDSGGRPRRQSEDEEDEKPDAFDDQFPTSQDMSELGIEEAIPVGEVNGEEVTYSRRGGMILHAEDGTLVPPPGEGEEEEEKTSAIPETVEEASSPAKKDPTVEREGKGDSLFQEAANITRDVMDEWNKELKEKPEAVAVNSKKDQDRIAKTPPATPEEMKAIYAKIDPNNELESYRKGAAALVEGYNTFIEQGDITKARKIAKKILDFNKIASMTLGQLALTAAEQGDLESASKLLVDAYDEVPDGGKIEAQPTPKGTVIYKIDREGYAEQRGEIGAQQLFALAANVASGKEYIARMTAFAAEGQPNTSESNAGGSGTGKKGSYTNAVKNAVRAEKDYEDYLARYNDATTEDKRKMREELKKLRKASDRAMDYADYAREQTRRSSKELSADLDAARKRTASALPPEPPEDKPEAKTYNSVITKAAKVQSELEALTNSYENLETDEERRAAYPQLQAKQAEYQSAYEAAAQAGEALGRDALGDIGKAAKNLPSALPLAPPEAPPEEPGFFSSLFGGSGPAPAQAAPQAVPTQPAPAPAGRPVPPETLAKAKDAIAKGASREAVIKRLQDAGFDTRGL